MAKDPKKVKRGEKSKRDGAAFELRVRKDLESQSWIVLKNPNTVIENKFVKGKSKYNPFTKRLMMNSGGFPDFICMKKKLTKFQSTLNKSKVKTNYYEVMGVESKTNGILDKPEKEKCNWLLEHNVFSKILIASKYKEKNKIKIRYKEYEK